MTGRADQERWGARAETWAKHAAGVSAPAWRAVAEATRIGERMRVLDVGCGTGEFCRLAIARGADVSGLDGAAGMVAVARRLVPGADLRHGSMERLPWDDAVFDVITGFNAFQFARDPVVALGEARRVARPGGQVVVCNWGSPEDNELPAVMGAMRRLLPGPPPAGSPAMGRAGALDELVREAGLDPVRAGAVDVPFEAPDLETMQLALLAPGAAAPVIEHAGEPAVREAIAAAVAPFERPDGSYRLENRFVYLVARAPGSGSA